MTRRRKGPGRVTPKKQRSAEPWTYIDVPLVWFSGPDHDCPLCAAAGSPTDEHPPAMIEAEKRNGPRLHPGAVQAQSFTTKEQRRDCQSE